MRTKSALEDWAQDLSVRLSWDADGGGWNLVRRRTENDRLDGEELQSVNRT